MEITIKKDTGETYTITLTKDVAPPFAPEAAKTAPAQWWEALKPGDQFITDDGYDEGGPWVTVTFLGTHFTSGLRFRTDDGREGWNLYEDCKPLPSLSNATAQARYDALMLEGRHGHYECMFRVVREACEAAEQPLRAIIAAKDEEITVLMHTHWSAEGAATAKDVELARLRSILTESMRLLGGKDDTSTEFLAQVPEQIESWRRDRDGSEELLCHAQGEVARLNTELRHSRAEVGNMRGELHGHRVTAATHAADIKAKDAEIALLRYGNEEQAGREDLWQIVNAVRVALGVKTKGSFVKSHYPILNAIAAKDEAYRELLKQVDGLAFERDVANRTVASREKDIERLRASALVVPEEVLKAHPLPWKALREYIHDANSLTVCAISLYAMGTDTDKRFAHAIVAAANGGAK